MGVEPIYSGSAGRRLNGSATPAVYISFETSINRLSTAFELLSNFPVNFHGRLFVLNVLYQHSPSVE